jgi:hypothetical protein
MWLQAVEYLLWNCKALSSSPPPPKKKNQTKPKNIQRGRQGGERKGREKENANMVIMIYLFFFFFQKAKNFFFLAFLWFWGLNPGTHEC